ncbi:MAG TPA: ATP-binding protein [Nitrososphaeraceae archaeon]|nr:ATP-binding protein [Nitrososphaeraceae archaeon]
MAPELKIHPSFFREFATKTWISPNEIVKELIENAFDEDATKVLVTLLKNGIVIIEDDAGMNPDAMEKFLILGSPHKKQDSISPKLKRIRTGRYGTGRLSFLTSFDNMKIRTRRDDFSKSILIDGNTLDKLFRGNVELDDINEPTLDRNGTELTMKNSKVAIDISRLTKEIRKLAILRHPMFEVYVKEDENFREWNFDGAQIIKAPEIQGHKVPVNIDNGRIIGEIVIARRPLSEDERGIAIMVGNHIVTRNNFGFDTKFNRVTGYIRCDTLTSRFADKSALIEDEEYLRFNQAMKTFIIDIVLPGLTEYEDVLITREESKIYREIDKVLGQAIIENLESQEEVQGYETLNMKEIIKPGDVLSSNINYVEEIPSEIITSSKDEPTNYRLSNTFGEDQDLGELNQAVAHENSSNVSQINFVQPQQQKQQAYQQTPSEEIFEQPSTTTISQQAELVEVVDEKDINGMVIRTRKVRKPIVKKTFALKKIGYKVIPYEDDSDSRYSFTNENVVFVNKANSTYRAEAARGDEFLLRHIISIVAETIAESKHPEGKNALELQNRLVAEAIRIHDYSVIKK